MISATGGGAQFVQAGDFEGSAECSMLIGKKGRNNDSFTNVGSCLRNFVSKRVLKCTSAIVVASSSQKNLAPGKTRRLSWPRLDRLDR